MQWDFSVDPESKAVFEATQATKATRAATQLTQLFVSIEGHPEPACNGVYVHDSTHGGWPVLKNGDGIYCYRYTPEDAWRLNTKHSGSTAYELERLEAHSRPSRVYTRLYVRLCKGPAKVMAMVIAMAVTKVMDFICRSHGRAIAVAASMTMLITPVIAFATANGRSNGGFDC